jgi:hypothetical protein
MSVNLSPVAGAAAQFLDNSGNVLTGGKLYTYLAGTTTPAATYTDSTGVTFHSNPIILDAAGRVPNGGEVWLSDNIAYKFVLKDANDVLIATWDNLTGINSNFVNYTVQEEIQTATAGQTVFNLATITYAPGTNSLSVYVDGVNQYDGIAYAYVETNANTITFTSGLHVGALVKFTTAVNATGTATNAAVVTYDPAGTGAVATTVQAKLREYVSVTDFGATGDGVTDDTAAIQAGIDHVSSTKQSLLFPEGTYIVKASKARTYAGGTLYCAFDLKSNITLFAQVPNTAIIKMANNESTYATPRNINIFFSNVYVENIEFKNLTCDMNGANNLISPNAPTTYNRYTCASFFISGNNIWAKNVLFEDCQFNNTSGTTQIGLGQSNLVGSLLSQNVVINRCQFHDNGTDTDDHSTVYMWAENARCENSLFEQSTSLSKTDKNWVAYEIHGANQWFVKNTVKNFYRGCWIGSNYTNIATNLWVTDNYFSVWAYGPSLFRQAATQTQVSEVHIARNNINVDNTAGLGVFKAAISASVNYYVNNIKVYDNIASFDEVGISNCGFIAIGNSAAVDSYGDFFIYNNVSTGAQNGVFARTYAASSGGVLTYIEEKNNRWNDLKVTSSGLSVGSYYISDAANPIQKVICKNNSYQSSGTSTGIRLEGGFDYIDIDGHDFDGMVSNPSGTSISINLFNPTLITRRLGKQVNTVSAAAGIPTSSTWNFGDVVYCYNPSRIKNFSHWVCQGANTFRVYGIGNGTTAERPSLTANEADYGYYDSNLGKVIVWSGTAWLV